MINIIGSVFIVASAQIDIHENGRVVKASIQNSMGMRSIFCTVYLKNAIDELHIFDCIKIFHCGEIKNIMKKVQY